MARHFQRPFTRPDGATEVVLVRHGSSRDRTADEPLDLLGGHSDPPLSDAGLAQAEAVGAALGGEQVAALFVTPLRRTAQTAAPLAARLGREPVVVPELREVFLGDWEQRLNSDGEDLRPLAREVFRAGRWDVIPNAEPAEQLAARVRDGLALVAAAAGPDATAVVVSHGGVIAEACRQVTESLPFAFLGVENGSITRLFRHASGRWTLRSFNATGHLPRV